MLRRYPSPHLARHRVLDAGVQRGLDDCAHRRAGGAERPGATGWRQAVVVVLPLIRPSIVTNLMLITCRRLVGVHTLIDVHDPPAARLFASSTLARC